MEQQRKHVTGHEFLGGAPLPVGLNLQVQITRGEPSDDLPAGLADALREHEQKLFAWMGRSRARRVQFLTDPVQALADAGIELDETTLEALGELQARAAPADVLPPGLRIETLSVDVESQRRGGA